MTLPSIPPSPSVARSVVGALSLGGAGPGGREEGGLVAQQLAPSCRLEAAVGGACPSCRTHRACLMGFGVGITSSPLIWGVWTIFLWSFGDLSSHRTNPNLSKGEWVQIHSQFLKD